ncbi:branched-chain amino acid transport system ATP-binding protein [Kaistia hirudinis]|uniref:Branched-chain amino acid transport system ATP-binding protein n=1 Tax=Kaistia hirudinis TaxID=1293440 RepID=A0A840AU34_9HYPH|nr:ABC transporter ATP-binding protein [Kaistia hirudinis]MBB3932567.1 branched-chain amino acid transport system ATP-binding protein [Kaistia hirudinis]
MSINMAKSQPMLEVVGLGKTFGGLAANADVSFSVARGSISGLIGPNGAGKSTLFKTILGVHRPDTGRIMLDGQDITQASQQSRCRSGLCCTFQISESFTEMDVRESAMVAAYCRTSRRSEARSIADAILTDLGLAARAGRRNSELNAFERKKAELATALATRPKLLLLDELFAGCSLGEISELIDILGRLNQRDGITLIIVEHVLHVIMSMSDQVIVLESGRIIETGTPEQVSTSPAVLKAYLGEDYNVDEHQQFRRPG